MELGGSILRSRMCFMKFLAPSSSARFIAKAKDIILLDINEDIRSLGYVIASDHCSGRGLCAVSALASFCQVQWHTLPS